MLSDAVFLAAARLVDSPVLLGGGRIRVVGLGLREVLTEGCQKDSLEELVEYRIGRAIQSTPIVYDVTRKSPRLQRPVRVEQ